MAPSVLREERKRNRVAVHASCISHFDGRNFLFGYSDSTLNALLSIAIVRWIPSNFVRVIYIDRHTLSSATSLNREDHVFSFIVSVLYYIMHLENNFCQLSDAFMLLR